MKNTLYTVELIENATAVVESGDSVFEIEGSEVYRNGTCVFVGSSHQEAFAAVEAYLEA